MNAAGGFSFNRERFLLNLVQASEPIESVAEGRRLERLARRLAARYGSEVEALEARTTRDSAPVFILRSGELDDPRSKISLTDRLFAAASDAHRGQDQWSETEFDERMAEWVKRWPRGRGASRQNREALALAHARLHIRGGSLQDIALILDRPVRFVQYDLDHRAIVSQMLQELGADPLPGRDRVDLSASPTRYPRIVTVEEVGRPGFLRYLPDSRPLGYSQRTAESHKTTARASTVGVWLRQNGSTETPKNRYRGSSSPVLGVALVGSRGLDDLITARADRRRRSAKIRELHQTSLLATRLVGSESAR